MRQLNEDRSFLRACNIGGEGMREDDIEHVRTIARYRWTDSAGHEANFLTEDELKNLTIRSGTLTAEERQVINHHIVATIRMLESLPWPKHLKNVPEYAGGHHERMDGKGYPKGLTRDQMSIQARVMGIADIFEALTAKDRPYKRGKTLSESLDILGRFTLGGHVDPGSVRHLRPQQGLPALRRDLPRQGADRRGGRIAHSRLSTLTCLGMPKLRIFTALD